jgi:hypothetical protein
MFAPFKPAPETGVAASLWQGVRAVFLLRPDVRRIDGSVMALCTLFVLQVAAAAACDLIWFDGQVRLNSGAVRGLFAELPFLLLAGWVAARRSVRGVGELAFPVLALAGYPVFSLLALVLFRLAAQQPALSWWLYYGLIAWWALALALAYVRLVGRGVARAGAGLVWVAVLAAMTFLPHADLFLPRQDADSEPPHQASVEREDALNAQATLLDDNLRMLQAQRPGIADLYFVGFAGHAAEDVFYKELQVIGPLMNQRFDTAGRSVLLVNNPRTVLQLPLATATNLRRSLRAISERINRDEDVVMVYLTSHGSRNHDFDVSFWPLELNDITPASLKAMFDEAGIKWRVIVVSACYAGGYIAPLRDDHTLVMTAADATHTSFGCGSESGPAIAQDPFLPRGLRRGRRHHPRLGAAATPDALQSANRPRRADGGEAQTHGRAA